VLLAVVGLLVAAKNTALTIDDGWLASVGGGGFGDLVTRNGFAALVTVVLVVAAIRRRQLFVALGLPPLNVTREEHATASWRWVLAFVFAWGVPKLALVLATCALLLNDPAWGRAMLLVAANAVLLARFIWLRARLAPDAGAQVWLPMWTFVPATLVVTAFAVAAFARSPREQDAVELLGVLVGTALLEELVFRGGLQSLSLRTLNTWVRLLVPGVAFGFWHLADAINDTHAKQWSSTCDSLYVVGTVIAMTLVSWLVLEPLRLRCRSFFGPWLLHAAVNGGFLALGASLGTRG
jgi:membrane protease YdiL (CAAX protease family)